MGHCGQANQGSLLLTCEIELQGLAVQSDLHERDRIMHGVPLDIISDRDPKFSSGFWNNLQSALGTEICLRTAHTLRQTASPRGLY